MPFPLLALAIPALIGVVGGVAFRWLDGRISGRPATPGQLLRAGLLGGVLGAIGGNAVNLARWLVGPVPKATVVVVGAWRADETARTARDFVETGRVPFVTTTAAPPPAPPPPRPLFAEGARDLLAAQLEESARTTGVPILDRTPTLLDRLTTPAPAPTRGLAGMIREGAGP